MNILVLSPHLDDALFSLSSFFLKFKGNVIVATIFTEENEHNFTGDYALYADTKTRKIEDTEAFKKIQKYNPNIFITQLYLNLPDELFRTNFKFVNLILNEKLNYLNQKYNFHKIYCPLAIGEHNDHLITYTECNKVFDKSNTYFYYDYPYCNLKLNTIKRLNYLQINHELSVSFNDIIEYYNHPIYMSTPRIVRIIKIIYNLFWCIFPSKNNNIEIYEEYVDCNIKNDIVSNYITQIKPIFGSFINLKNTLTKYCKEVYLNII